MSFACLSLLLTHSSGVVYDFMSPLHQVYHDMLGKPRVNYSSTILNRFTEPLLFEPGTGWSYGPGIDWAGILVERLTNTRLECYMREHMWKPLGVEDTTFWPTPALKERMAGMTIRDPSIPHCAGRAIPYPTSLDIFAGVTDEMGGQGLFSSMPSYLKVLHSILRDDGKLLQNPAIMFEPQLTGPCREALQREFGSRNRSAVYIGDFPENVPYNWGLGGLLTMEDVDEDGWPWRRKNSLAWSGLPNLFWVRVFMSQLSHGVPPVPKTKAPDSHRLADGDILCAVYRPRGESLWHLGAPDHPSRRRTSSRDDMHVREGNVRVVRSAPLTRLTLRVVIMSCCS
jgi:CubicO group peptidase (beta-lactamase class C family)